MPELEELSRPRENPFGKTNGDLKKGLELGLDEYSAINGHRDQSKLHPTH
jgi:N-acetylneuraminate synthase